LPHRWFEDADEVIENVVDNIESFPSLAPGVSWFVALPDCDAGPAARRLERIAPLAFAHPSGRPWLLGAWSDDEVAVAHAGELRIALLGHHGVTGQRLQDVARSVGSITDVDRYLTHFDGSFHLVASVRGTVRVQGTVLGLRPVYTARSGAVTIAADRADVLAALTGAAVDEEQLTLRLLFPPVLPPVTDRTVWRGVERLEPDSYVLLDEAGRDRAVRHWTPPEPSLSLTEGAVALREALSSAVAARLDGDRPVSCDLSGLDSTAICSLAARNGAPVTAITFANPDPRDDDVMFARRTVSGFPSVEHVVMPPGDTPLFYDGLLDTSDRLDEPCNSLTDRARFLSLIGVAAKREPRVHFNGFGGDEALQGALNHLHGLMRSDPRVALGHIRGLRAKFRWSYREILRQLVGNRPYRDWLDKTADGLTAPTPNMRTPLLDWSWPPRFAPWVTPAAVETAHDLIKREVEAAEPLAPQRGLHFDLTAMRYGARGARHYDQVARGLGVATSSPFYDDKVVTVALSVEPQHRLNPWLYKPLIVEALRGVVPAPSLERTTKADWSVAHATGQRAHRDRLIAIADDSRLARLGLIDADTLRDWSRKPLSREFHPGIFDSTAGCERWLRSLETTHAYAEGSSNASQAA
jgi:asparagine synthase (glutamine-hydrolysing)